MNDTELDLVLALADGRLSAADAAAARTRIAADPNLAAELKMQRLAVDRLHDLPTPTLDEAERERLHASLRAQLHLEPITVPVPVTPQRRRSWWLPVTGLATAAVVLAGVLYVVPRVGDQSTADNVAAVATFDSTEEGGSTEEGDVSSPSPTTGTGETQDGTSPQSADDSTATATPSTGPRETETPVEAEAPSPEPDPPAADAPQDGDADDPTIEVTDADPIEVTDADPIVVPDLGADVPSADEILDLLGTSGDDPQSSIDAYAGTSAPTANVDAAQMAACAAALESAGGGREAVPIASGIPNGQEVVVVGFLPTADSPAMVSVIALDGCQIVSSATAGS
jgi:anti-sigma factor RsiW